MKIPKRLLNGLIITGKTSLITFGYLTTAFMFEAIRQQISQINSAVPHIPPDAQFIGAILPYLFLFIAFFGTTAFAKEILEK